VTVDELKSCPMRHVVIGNDEIERVWLGVIERPAVNAFQSGSNSRINGRLASQIPPHQSRQTLR